MIDIEAYCPSCAQEWDAAIATSRNGTFLFMRDFMDYHADRFTDASLVFRRKGKIVALLPQSLHENGREWRSHGGLTYGGLVLSPGADVLDVLTIFDLVAEEAQRRGVVRQIYKPVPACYRSGAAQEDLYALFRADAVRIGSQVDSVIDLRDPLRSSSLRRRMHRRAKREGFIVTRCDDPGQFHAMLAANLRDRHDTEPVHTVDEMRLLESRFPDAIATWGVATRDGDLVAGSWVFDTGPCVHTQYIASTPAGREAGALDLLFFDLIERAGMTANWFSFGTSNDATGRELNVGLVRHKISFGARAVVYDTYARDFA